MFNKEYFATKELSKLHIDGKTYFRIVHHLGKVITNISVFELGKNTKDGELNLTEVLIHEVPDEVKPFIMSDVYEVDVKNDDKSLIIEALQTKMIVMKDFAKKHIDVGMKRKLMQFIEVGGHYFGFVFEEGMPYTKLYHMSIDPVRDEVHVGDVPPDMLPALFEALSGTILGKTSDLTIQVGEGIYARVSLVDEETALVTLVMASESQVGETQLSVLSGFTLEKMTERDWAATIVKGKDVERIQKEMEKSFEVIYQELLIKVFEVSGEEALKGV